MKKQKIEEKNFVISNFEGLKSFLKKNGLNPMEQVMAVKLLTEGYNFYAQYKIELPEGWNIHGRTYFVADFLLPEFNIIIETEGKIHDQSDKYEYDRLRNNALVALGYRVFRFSWDEVMQKNPKFNIFYFIEELLTIL